MLDDKKEVRRQIRALKRAMTDDEKRRQSEFIMQQVEQMTAFLEAQTVLLYWSMDDEVQTHDFVDRWCQSKKMLLPCVDGDDLLLRPYTGRDCLVAGEQFGIGEPAAYDATGNALPVFKDLEAIDLIIVPGVAFDRDGNRLGRGRGFYDRMLKSTPNALKVGLAFDFQMLDKVPTEPFDVKMDFVISGGNKEVNDRPSAG